MQYLVSVARGRQIHALLDIVVHIQQVYSSFSNITKFYALPLKNLYTYSIYRNVCNRSVIVCISKVFCFDVSCMSCFSVIAATHEINNSPISPVVSLHLSLLKIYIHLFYFLTYNLLFSVKQNNKCLNTCLCFVVPNITTRGQKRHVVNNPAATVIMILSSFC